MLAYRQGMNSPLVNGSFYHVYNRGVAKRIIFEESENYHRFLETLSYYRFHPTPRKLSTHLRFNDKLSIDNNVNKQLVKILCFCLMPNHFHLLLQQLEENGISIFIRKVADSFTRYFNTKNDRVGPLFQGKFKAKVVESDEYLLQLSKYIHRNPLKLPLWTNRLPEYSFSSYPGYLNQKRKVEFCDIEDISSYFKNYGQSSTKNPKSSYQSFVEESEDVSIPDGLLIDSD